MSEPTYINILDKLRAVEAERDDLARRLAHAEAESLRYASALHEIGLSSRTGAWVKRLARDALTEKSL